MGKKKENTPAHHAANSERFINWDNQVTTLLEQSDDAMIILDENGLIYTINKVGARLFGKPADKLIHQSIGPLLEKASFSQKRLFIMAKRRLDAAEQGIPQLFNWEEHSAARPIMAYTVVISTMKIQDKTLYLCKLHDILQTRLIKWALWSLARINTQGEITAVIDQILQLVSETYHADYALVSLIDSHNTAHTVSHYHKGIKIDNTSFELEDSSCGSIVRTKRICYHDTGLQKTHPKDQLIQRTKMDSCLMGPLINSDDQVVGLLTLLSAQTINLKPVEYKLFKLFLSRVSLEIERLLYQRKLQFLASIPQQDPNPIIRILPTGEVIFANSQGKSILNYWNETHAGLPTKITADAQKARTSGQIVRNEATINDRTYLLTLVWVPDFNQINIYGTDITQLKAAEQDILNLARYDALTQVANRQYFEEKLIKNLAEHQASQQQLSLLLIDLDNFKVINDTLGHPIGDRLLQAATKRMERCLRQDDFIARLGGDEFIVMLSRTGAEAATIVADKINTVLSKPFQFGEYRMDLSCSIGIAVYPESGVNSSDLLKHADIAMYQAKRAGKDRYALFSNQLHYVQHQRHNIIKKDLKHAAAKNELSLEYQPEFDLASGEIMGFEALLRWNHPEQGLILPVEFIPLAEQSGVINTIGQWGIEQAITDYAKLIAPIYPKARLCINVSLMQISDARFLDTLCDNLQLHNLGFDRLILDISEHIMTSNLKEVYKTMSAIHARGIKLSLDNFGGPQVSLTKLLELPIDYIKLDPKLLHGIENKDKQKQLISGIIELAAKLGIKVVQKGVEKKEQNEELKDLGCEFVQGYYYCQPVNIKKLQQFLKQYKPDSNKKE